MANSISICLNDTLQATAKYLERSLQVPTQLLVIDAGVENFSTLVNGVHPGAKVLVLDSEQNGIIQISQALRSHPSITTLSILAHGFSGCIHLGNTPLNGETLAHHSRELSTWFPRARNPQIHLYSCNVALGHTGIEFLQTLHHLTKASIAASTQLIGRTASGSNWQLNYQLGQIDTPNPISSDILEAYQGVLASPVITDAITIPRSTSEETVLGITGVTISDTDGGIQTVTVSVSEGNIALATGSGVTVSGSTATSITFTGTIAQVNAAINGMSYTPGLNYADDTTLSISSNDGTTTVTKVLAIAVTPVNDTPTIAPSAATVAEGGNVNFVVTNFGIADVDNIAAQIIIKVAALPGKGFLVLDGGKLAVGSSFSSDRIPDLKYVHDGTQTTAIGGTSDSFSITVADGAGGVISSTAIPITITPINQLPTVTGSVTLFEGEANKPVTITISDLDQTAANYTIKILSQPVNPAHGVLTFNGVAVTVGQTFSSADLANLTYSHFGNDENFGNPPNVTFDVEVLDDGGGTGTPGAKTATILLNIKANNDDPILATNTGAIIDTASTREVVITNANLNVTDPDSGIPQLTYTISQAVDPTLGSLQLNGSKIGLGATFTQADINQGRLKYVFNRNTTAGENFTDSFKFEVRDSSITEFPTVREGGVYSGGVIAQNTFTISISTPNAITDAAGSNAPTVITNTAPVIANNLGIGQSGGSPPLTEGGPVEITSAMLSVTDPDNTPEQLVYRIEKSPTNGTFKLNGSPVNLYGSFTQQDINDGKVSFQHDSNEDFIDNDITFSVSDGTNLLKNQKFKLDVIPQNDVPVVTVGTTVSLAEGTEQTITTANFSLSDVDGSGEKTGQGFATVNSLTFKVTELPLNGDLYIDQGSGYVRIDASNFGTLIITNNQLISGKLKYVHAGDENVADSFKVQAFDDSGTPNNFSSIRTINIEIAKINDAPQPSAPVINLTVAEAGTGTIKGSNALVGEPRLVYTDPDNTTIQRQYAITSKTTHGAILLNGKTLAVGSVFTQNDLDNNRVTYKHDGTEFYTDSFNFEVRDGAALPVPGSYGITITPTNDSPTLSVPTTQTFATTAPLVFSTTNSNPITFTDPDLVALDVGETDIIRVTLDLQVASATYTGSTLTLGSTTGVTVTLGTNGIAGGKIVFEGTKVNIQAALEGLQVQVPTDEDRILSLVVTVDDRNNGGPDAPIPQPTIVTKTIDIKASNVNDTPTIPTTPASVIVAEDTFLSFTGANSIAIQDVDSFGTTNNTVTLSVTQGTLNLNPGAATISGGANGSGTITLTGSLADINAAIASLSYKGNPEYNGSDSLRVIFDDAGNLGIGGAKSVIQNIAITVTPVNDAPTIVAPGSTLAIEDGNPLTFSGANLISIDDAKDLGPNGNGLDTFTVVVEAFNGATPFGKVLVATGSGATISNDNTASVTISGTKAQVNAALNGLSYTPTDSNVDATVTLKVTAKDQANGGTAISGGAGGELTDIKNILINVSGVNDPAVVIAPISVTATEDTLFSFPLNSLKVDDPDDFGKPLKVTLTVGKGTLIFGSTTGLTVTGTGTTKTLQGKESDINAALNTLQYQGNSNYNTVGISKDTLTILADDLGNSGTAGLPPSPPKTVDITVIPVNDAPIASGSATVTAVAEDSTNPSGSVISTLLSSHYNDAADTVTGGSTATPFAGIAIIANASTAAKGTWQYGNGSTWTNIPTTGLSNSSALVIAESDQLRFVPVANFNGIPGALTVRLSDGTGFVVGSGKNVGAGGGSSGWSASTVAIGTSITAVNDAPVATGSSSLTAVLEDATNPAGATVTSLFGSRFSDTTDTVAGGSTANTLAGVAIVGNAATAAQGAWQYFNGTSWIAIANPTPGAALVIAAGTGLRFLPNADFNGTPGGLTVNLIDSSGTATTGNILDLTTLGTGGITPYSSSTVPLTTSVTPVNDAPSGADNVKTVAEDTSYTFAAIDFGFSNPADPTDTLSAVKISSLPTNGKLQLNGVDITTANVVVSLADINGSKLKFIPDLNENGSPYGNFTFVVRDNSGVTATEFDPTPNTFIFNVTPVNDPPTGQDKTITAVEDTGYAFATADFGFADVDGDTFSSVRIDTLPSNGTLKLNGTLVTVGQDIAVADIIAGVLVFTAAPNANGVNYDNFNFSVKDSSGLPATEFDLTPNKITFNVTAKNDPPTGQDKTITAIEDTGYALTVVDFGFADIDTGDSLSGVRIDTLPTNGTLKFNGSLVTAGQIITTADITANKLVFTANVDANGMNYANFTFSVKDSSGDLATQFDTVPNTITFNVTAKNDPPTGQDKTITAIEDTGYALTVADFGFADIDTGDSLSGVRIDTLPTNGTLKLNGSLVTAGQIITAADITAGNLIFTAAPNANGSNYSNFNFSVRDSSGDVATQFDTAPNKITFSVTPSNDPPTGQDKTITAIEDTGYALTVADFGFADIDTGDSLSGVRIDTLPTNGTLKLNGSAVTAGQIITTADITSGNLVFTAATDANGTNYANFTFSVRDNSGIAASEFDILPNTLTFNVTAKNDPPTGQDKTITAIEDTGYALTVADFGFADIDTGDSLSGVRIDTLPTNGTLKLNGIAVTAGQIITTADITANKLVFTATADTNGNSYANLTFSVRDSSGDLTTQFDPLPNTITFNVTPANDPPTGQDKTLTTVEDTGYPLTVADFGFTDIDGDTFSGIRIDTLPNGTLKLSGVPVTVGQIITAADITAGKLVFTPELNINGNNSDTFTFSVQDSSGDVLTQFDTVPNTLTFNVLPANDSPTGQDKTIPTVEDTPYVFTTSDFGFSDIDPGDTFSGIRIDTLPASGTFKVNGADVIPGQVISATDIAAGKLIFSPATNATGNNAFNFSVRDSSGDPATEFDPVPNTIILNVSPDNDPPTGQDKTISSVEDTSYPLTTADFGFSDIDPGDTLSGVRIDTLPNGTLKLNNILVTTGQVISAGDIAAGNLVFMPALNANGNDTFTFSVKDNSGNIISEFDTAPNTLTFNIAPVNDPPSGQDKTIAASEDTPYIFTTSDFGFNDIDAGDTLSGVRIDIPPASGTFILDGVAIAPSQFISAADITAGKLIFTPASNTNGNANAAFTFSVRDSSGDSATEFDLSPNTIIFNVTPTNDSPTGQDKTITAVEDTGYSLTTADFGFADIDTGDSLSGVRIDSLPGGTLKLSGVSVTVGQVISVADIIAGNLVFTPALNLNSNDTFTFSVKDSSGDIATEFDTAPNILTFNVTPVNDPPTGQDKIIPTVEDTPYIFATSDFGFSDLDLGDTLSGVRIDTLPTSGTFTLNGTSITLGQVISAADITAGNLVFTPLANIIGSNTFTFSVRDSSGNSTTEFDLVPNTIDLNVSPANDPPTGQDKAILIVEDTGYPLTTADFGFSDVDVSDTLTGVRIDTLPTSGTFTLNGASITLGQVISAADIAAGKFIFTPALNANGSTNFTFSVRDSSSDPISEFDPTPNQIIFNIAPVKDAPTGQDKTIAATGGIGYPLTTNDFGFADADGDTFSDIRIETLPANGMFQLNGANVTAGQVISTNDIVAGKLVFTVAPGTNGANYANFAFSVKDNSGDASTEFDAVPNTITFNVASNLPPLIDLDGNNSSSITGNNYQVLYIPGQLSKIADTDVKITDVDDLNMESATLILTTRPNGASESLALTGALPNGINASAYDPLTGILKLTGSASIADYQAAIASITYKNTIIAKNTSNRTVTVMVNDGEKDSSIATTTILFDSDGDRSADSSDLDDDNDGIPDLVEQNGNPNRDTDGDGILDTLDLDADNDGITDLQESGLSTVTIAVLDKDNDGVIDATNNFGSNGLSNSLETTPDSGILNYVPVDTDGDKKPNFQDLDSDNDGLTDLVESGSGYPDGNNDKMVDGIDSDGDGILDPADKGAGFGGGSRPPLKDSNNNGIPDFMEISVSRAQGSNGSDTIIGTDGDDILNGFSDLDIIYGRGGNDLINGGSDRDVLRGDEGNDTINGGTDNDDIQGGTGNDSISGGDGDDLIRGNDGDDVLSGDRGNDRIYGGKGKDIINGSDGNDRLYGDEDDDIVRGYRGNDLLVGGLGKDELTGGQGRDVFKYRSVKEFSDTITDFEIIKDRFDLRKIFHRRGSISNIELQQSGKDTIVGVSFKGKEYTLGMLEDVNANTLKARHFKF